MLILLRVVAIAVGTAVTTAVVVSALRTVVVPRPEPVWLTDWVFRAVRWLFAVRLPQAASYEQRDRHMALYAPFSLIVLPMAWIALVLVAYALIFWGVGDGPLGHAFLLSGSSLLTLGFEPPSTAAGVVIAFTEAALGLAVLALLLVTYLPSMYAAFSRREQAVILLEVRAGSPPSAVTFLSRYARISGLASLTDIWQSWEALFADLQETHTSLPALVFFRSQRPDQNWVTAAGALLDAASLYASTVDLAKVLDDPHGRNRVPEAETCIRAGYLALRHICDYFKIPYDADPRPDDPITISRDEYDEACEAMRDAGVPLRDDMDAAWGDFAGWRVNYDTVLVALAALVMAPYAPWSSDRSLLSLQGRRAVGRFIVDCDAALLPRWVRRRQFARRHPSGSPGR